jgi:hypothetical protein
MCEGEGGREEGSERASERKRRENGRGRDGKGECVCV